MFAVDVLKMKVVCACMLGPWSIVFLCVLLTIPSPYIVYC